MENLDKFLTNEYEINFEGDLATETAKKVLNKFILEAIKNGDFKKAVRNYDLDLEGSQVNMVVEAMENKVLTDIQKLLKE